MTEVTRDDRILSCRLTTIENEARINIAWILPILLIIVGSLIVSPLAIVLPILDQNDRMADGFRAMDSRIDTVEARLDNT